MGLARCLLVVLALGTLAAADDFRIETRVFAGRGKDPVSQNLTLFQAGYVYDYLSEPDRVAVFDQAHGRFILLDPSRKLKAEIKIDDVLEFTTKLRELTEKSSNAFMKFAANPEFEKSFSQDGELNLASRHISYRLKTEPAKTPQAAKQYRDFSDWYARFNSMTNPGSTPPFARMTVNEELAQRGLVPIEVHLTINDKPALSSRAVTMRTEHHVSYRLLQKDLAKIAETANQLATFKTAEVAELRPKSSAKR